MPLELRSPQFERAVISVPDEVANLQKSFNGTICSEKGDEYRITNNIIDLMDKGPKQMTFAQQSNHWKITVALYEDIWRKRSLSILTGQEFPIEKEQQLLVDWLNPKPDKLYLDIGCSTGLYGRLVNKSEPSSRMISLDFSMQMLQEARTKSEAENIEAYLLRADARQFPFFAAEFDGLMMGGTLNEMSNPLKVLYEARRVIKKEGTFFMMHLIKADAWYGQILQNSAELGGLSFWNLQESNQLFERAGFAVSEQFSEGIVCFSKLVPE